MGRPIYKIYINNDAKMLKRGGVMSKEKKIAGGLAGCYVYRYTREINGGLRC